MSSVLIGFATRTAAAAEIAETVAKVLRGAGHSVRLSNLDRQPGVDGAELVVIGSGINASAYYPEAVAWLKGHETELKATRLALFNTCLNAADPGKLDQALAYNDGAVARYAAVSHASFAGRFEPAKASWFSRLFARFTGRKAQDHVDSTAAEAWAEQLLTVLPAAV